MKFLIIAVIVAVAAFLIYRAKQNIDPVEAAYHLVPRLANS
jgi:hypothetical protein